MDVAVGVTVAVAVAVGVAVGAGVPHVEAVALAVLEYGESPWML